MRCSGCGSENSRDAAFCEQCGARLQTICRSCRTPAGPAAKFCRSCGASLSDDRTQKGPERASSTGVTADDRGHEVLDGERKTVTALFADIKGSTELMRDLDPEEARAIVDPALKLMIDAAHRYDGYVVQSTGDGIFALFGAPVAHEDHPQRALRAAISMRDALRDSGEQLKRPGRSPVEVRIGINTGEVVLRMIHTGGHTEYTPSGRGLLRTARVGQDRSQRS